MPTYYFKKQVRTVPTIMASHNYMPNIYLEMTQNSIFVMLINLMYHMRHMSIELGNQCVMLKM